MKNQDLGTRRRPLNRITALAVLVAIAIAATGCGQQDPEPLLSVEAELSPVLAARDNAEPAVIVLAPVEGERIQSPFVLLARVENTKLAPKGRVRDGEGHLHILVDQPCISPGTVIPDDAAHIHIGDGADRFSLDLPAGPHTLCVQVGDGFHSATSILAKLSIVVVD